MLSSSMGNKTFPQIFDRSSVYSNNRSQRIERIFEYKTTKKKKIKKENREKLPTLIIIEGVDAVGKTTVVENTMKQLNKEGKCIFNRHKRRREDKGLFKDAKIETEYIFRKEVVEQINKRMINYRDDTNYIILDKSPYSEYYYQKTP